MKAKEYFRKYTEENQDEEPTYRFVKILMVMFNGVAEITIARNAKSNSAMISIMDEQNTKANSFTRKVNETEGLGIRRDAFKHFIIDKMSELAELVGWGKISTDG